MSYPSSFFLAARTNAGDSKTTNVNANLQCDVVVGYWGRPIRGRVHVLSACHGPPTLGTPAMLRTTDEPGFAECSVSQNPDVIRDKPPAFLEAAEAVALNISQTIGSRRTLLVLPTTLGLPTGQGSHVDKAPRQANSHRPTSQGSRRGFFGRWRRVRPATIRFWVAEVCIFITPITNSRHTDAGRGHRRARDHFPSGGPRFVPCLPVASSSTSTGRLEVPSGRGTCGGSRQVQLFSSSASNQQAVRCVALIRERKRLPLS